ncbi:Uncharacterised protein [uncultured archaeon]|nr:Uncharacterised protein [uncultured archaeon]
MPFLCSFSSYESHITLGRVKYRRLLRKWFWMVDAYLIIKIVAKDIQLRYQFESVKK